MSPIPYAPGFLIVLATAPGWASADRPRLETAAVLELGATAEIVSLQEGAARAVVSGESKDGKGGVWMLDLSDPAQPTVTSWLELPLEDGEAITSVALPPTGDWFLAAIENGDLEPGRLLICDLAGAVLAEHVTGVGPDCVVIDPSGRRALVADEAEGYRRAGDGFASPPGSLTLVDLRKGPENSQAVRIDLPSAEGVIGMVRGDYQRELEREVEGVAEVAVPLPDNSPAHLEPEYVAYSPDGSRAYVSLQENNGVVVVDMDRARVSATWGLGLTRHIADTTEDGEIRFDTELWALREPDAIAIAAGGRLLVTADEGDTDPKASKTPTELPTAGGRTVSVFDASDGRFLGDTGNQLDAMAVALGIYPDDRSDSKGSEPEGVTAFDAGGKPWVAVALERASAVALVDLSDPACPTVVTMAPVGDAPEGIASVTLEGTRYVITANEGDGSVTILRLVN